MSIRARFRLIPELENTVALGYIGLRIMAVVFIDRPTDKPNERRIISLRKANTREVKRYAET